MQNPDDLGSDILRDVQCKAQREENTAPFGQDVRLPNSNREQDWANRNQEQPNPEEYGPYPEADRIGEGKQGWIVLLKRLLANGMQTISLSPIVRQDPSDPNPA